MTKHSIPFDQLLLSKVPSLRAYARSLCRDPNLADDIVQDALLAAWTKRASLRDLDAIKPWLLTIVRNTYLAHVRRCRKEVEDVDGRLAARQSAPATQETSSELSDVKRAMNALSDEEREALVLVCIDQLTYQEAAQVCACPVGTIKSRVNRARSQLLAYLKDDSFYFTSSRAANGIIEARVSTAEKPQRRPETRNKSLKSYKPLRPAQAVA